MEPLHLYVCANCSHVSPLPQHTCSRCWAREMVELDTSGRGTIYTATRVFVSMPDNRWQAELPYDVGLIELIEGVMMLGRLRGVTDIDHCIGQEVRGEVVDGIPVFTPLASG